MICVDIGILFAFQRARFKDNKMAVSPYLPIFVAVVVLAVSVGYTSSLACYQCADSGGEDVDCQDASALLNITKPEKKEGEEEPDESDYIRKNKYYKNCDDVNQTMCMIESHVSQGVVKSYIRDCSDGETFSFAKSKYPRLENLPANNETTCTYDVGPNIQICVTLCTGDVCNGPQLVPKEEIECRNVTNVYGETEVICGASSLSHFLMHTSLNTLLGGVFGFGYLVPFIVYSLAVFLMM
ncbi:uncharacterized protein LOC124268210 [Haliotis rubra]|uniref:uncharacterized protein LOC124268210 n=1 Tax=Haliotis rubra TaxID=36100 RepID=UPI001EE4F9E1|nr:uncharacterized protein LOC124268210 [Haliotis rubra]